MNKSKKPYAKPVLKAIKIMEVGAATCCRTTVGSCATNTKNNLSKGQRTVTVS